VQEYTVADISHARLNESERLGIRFPKVTLDSAAFARTGNAVTLSEEYRSYGIPCVPSEKPRLADSLSQLNELVSAAGTDAPALYIDRRNCPYLTYAMTNAQSDERDVEVIDPRYPADHPIDALRYALGFKNRSAQYKTQVDSRPMHEVFRYENPDEVRLNMHIAEARRYALAKQPRAQAVKPKSTVNVASIINSALTRK
jgi:hypothetical protein